MKRLIAILLLAGCGDVAPVHTWGDLCAERADLLATYSSACDQQADHMADCCDAHDCAAYPSPEAYEVATANLDQCALCLDSDGCDVTCEALPLPCEVQP